MEAKWKFQLDSQVQLGLERKLLLPRGTGGLRPAVQADLTEADDVVHGEQLAQLGQVVGVKVVREMRVAPIKNPDSVRLFVEEPFLQAILKMKTLKSL